jgi:hypothetical protein
MGFAAWEELKPNKLVYNPKMDFIHHWPNFPEFQKIKNDNPALAAAYEKFVIIYQMVKHETN